MIGHIIGVCCLCLRVHISKQHGDGMSTLTSVVWIACGCCCFTCFLSWLAGWRCPTDSSTAPQRLGCCDSIQSSRSSVWFLSSFERNKNALRGNITLYIDSGSRLGALDNHKAEEHQEDARIPEHAIGSISVASNPLQKLGRAPVNAGGSCCAGDAPNSKTKITTHDTTRNNNGTMSHYRAHTSFVPDDLSGCLRRVGAIFFLRVCGSDRGKSYVKVRAWRYPGLEVSRSGLHDNRRGVLVCKLETYVTANQRIQPFSPYIRCRTLTDIERAKKTKCGECVASRIQVRLYFCVVGVAWKTRCKQIGRHSV